MFTSNDTSRVVSVWSAYGHRFMGEDDNRVSCLTCGALYEMMADEDDPASGAYMAANGDDPLECTRDTGMAHGYPGERFCHEHHDFPQVTECEQGPGCSHTEHECNCLFCC